MEDLRKELALKIIENVGSSGTPPVFGLKYYSVGLDKYLDVIDKEYFEHFVPYGGAAFKLVVGIYGGGKTHFLYSIRDRAWERNFITSYVQLSPGESPFHRLDLVYRAIVNGLQPPLSVESSLINPSQGLEHLIKWLFAKKYRALEKQGFSNEEIRNKMIIDLEEHLEEIENKSFSRAIKGLFEALLDDNQNKFNDILQWLTVEGFDKKKLTRYGILQRIDKTSAFSMIRSLAQFIKEEGFAGLIILFDEAERIPSLSSQQTELHLNNLRELIDECGQPNFQNIMIFYAVPDETFLEGRTQTYEALKQRLSTVFDFFNPTGIKIDLEKLNKDPIKTLTEIGNKLLKVFEKAYEISLESDELKSTIQKIAEKAYETRFGDVGYKRIFVQNVIKAFHYAKNLGKIPRVEDLGM
ncbi:MAG: DUF2791 family P-loop domain-containing protein [Candidatus Aenigmatarchaeota archaeon]